jgi:hypothetical protein
MALIDKDSLKANIIKRLGISGEEYLLPAERVLWNVINAEPTQEIIHCKDCKYWKEKPLYTYCGKMYRMGILDVLDYATEENDFCSMAEKRGEDDETDCDYERAVEQLEHDMLYEPTFDPDDGSM